VLAAADQAAATLRGAGLSVEVDQGDKYTPGQKVGGGTRGGGGGRAPWGAPPPAGGRRACQSCRLRGCCCCRRALPPLTPLPPKHKKPHR
jgi:hypothetical protein